MRMISRRNLICTSLAALTLGIAPSTGSAKGEKGPEITVFKTRTCGCCQAWVDHLQKAGFRVDARNVSAGQLSGIKQRVGIRPQLASCHTAKIGDYIIEGHVPASDIRRLLAEKPAAIGLSVPGMPMGSPGMDFGDEREKYATLLVRRDGQTRVFQRHN